MQAITCNGVTVQLDFEFCTSQSLGHKHFRVVHVRDVRNSIGGNCVDQEVFYSLSLEEKEEVFFVDILCEGTRDHDDCLVVES
jgi:hypothetical protein